VLAGLTCGAVYGYLRWTSPVAAPTYKTAEVARGDVVQTVSATGNVEPLLKVLVGSQVSGTVMRWYADFNQQVSKDFVLAELDQERFKAALSQRSAALAVAKAKVEESAAMAKNADIELERLKRAFERQAASDFEIRTAETASEAARAALHGAEAQVEAARADLQQAQVELNKTIIKSPIDGVVISRDVDEGQTVAASLQAPTLFTIANDLRKMRVNAAVSETDIGKIHEGMDAQFRVDAYPGRKFRGVVSQVRFAETIVDNVVTYKTMIDVDNHDLSLRPGMTATILFEVAKVQDVIIVPNAALRFDPNAVDPSSSPAAGANPWSARPARGRPAQPRVFRLEDGQQLVEVPIQAGLNDGTMTQVASSDLKPGDRIVVEQTLGGGGGRRGGPQQRMPRGM
jgi:HlyD family secretion protein